MANIINLTPHTLNIHTPDGVVDIEPSGQVARVTSSDQEKASINGIPTVFTVMGEIAGLPYGPVQLQPETFYVVSGMVAASCPRRDILSPGPLVRDNNGRPVGCHGLRRSV